MDDLLLSMTNHRLVQQLIDAHGLEQAVRILARVSGYRELPPRIDAFYRDREFLGSSTEEGQRLFAVWRQVLGEIFPNPFYSPYLEVIMTGAIGTGKSSIAVIGMLYDLCKVLCLEKPQEHFKLLNTTIIAFALMNVTKDLARAVNLDMVHAYLTESPYFKRLLRTKRSAWHPTLFPRNIDIVAGSRFDQTTGRSVISVLLDEVNFQTKIKDQAINNYHSIRTRMESRFLGKERSYPSHMWLVSSKSDETGWLTQHVEKTKALAHVKVVDLKIWDAVKDKGIYSGETFKVFIGDQRRDPFIVRHADEVRGFDDAFLLDVPIEYQERFELDLPRSLQELAGTGTFSSNKFLSSSELIEECQIRDNPVTRVELQLDFFDDQDQIMNYLQYERIQRSHLLRFLHIDLGLVNDRVGIASVRFDGFVQLKTRDPMTLQDTIRREPIFYLDFLLAMRARPGQEFPIGKIKTFMGALRKRSYPIGVISADGLLFSANLRQDLTLEGFQTEWISVDRTKDPYDYFRQTIVESRFNGVKHPIFDHEVRHLLDTTKKIDHPPEGSKDTTDATCGAVYLAHMHQDSYSSVYGPDDFFRALDRQQSETTDPLLSEVEKLWARKKHSLLV